MSIILSIVPVFLVVLCGYYCRQRQFFDDGFWRGAEKITYFVLFPSLLVNKLSTADISKIDFFESMLIVGLLLLIVTVGLIIFKSWISQNGEQFCSIYQGSIRQNAYIGFAVVSSLYGVEGLVVSVVVMAIMIPMLNILCVVVLEVYGNKNAQGSKWRLLYTMSTNPLIGACVIGMLINISGVRIPLIFSNFLDIFASAALLFGLLTVGAALNLRAIGSSLSPLVVASTTKFLVMPLVSVVLCRLFNVDVLFEQVLLVLSVLPTANASYVLAKQLGGDAELMATIVTVELLLAMLFIPLVIWLHLLV